jgi:hypothetical protein
MPATPAATFPLAITMTRKQISRGAWSLPHWEGTGVVAGEQFAGSGRTRTLVHEADGVQQFLFKGYVLNLYPDAAANYWFNLMAESPSLFILCQKTEGEELVPSSVSADFADAEAAVEKDGAAFAVPIPPEIYVQLERFVLDHYKPQPKRKRKRDSWKEGEPG